MARSVLPWAVRLLAAVALGLSGYLWWTSATTETAVGCNAFAGFDCDAALASPWAKWLGVPVAVGGVVCYSAALVGSLLAGRGGGASAAGWRLLEATAPLAVGAGLWFMVIQATALDSFCLYCLLTHACGLLMAGAIWWWRASAVASAPSRPVGLSPVAAIAAPADHAPDSGRGENVPPLGVPTVVGILGLIALSGGQTIFATPTYAEFDAKLDDTFVFSESPQPDGAADSQIDPEPEGEPNPAPRKTASPERRRNGERQIAVLNGGLKLDTYKHAVLGSPDAPYIVVEMMDYACPHCREFHEKLTEALERFDGQIAVVVMPVPGEITCNPHVRKARKQSAGACYAAKLSMAVAQLAPDEFPRFHEWMLHDDTIPSRTASLIEARRHVDGDQLSAALQDADGRLAKRVHDYVTLAAKIGRQGRFGLPAQVLGDKVIAGPVEDVDKLCETWAEAFGIERPKVDLPF